MEGLTSGADKFPPLSPPKELFPNPGMRYDCHSASNQSMPKRERRKTRTYIPERSLMKHIIHRRIMECTRITNTSMTRSLLLRLGTERILSRSNERFHSRRVVDVSRRVVLMMRIRRRGTGSSARSGIRTTARKLVLDECSKELGVEGGSVRIVDGATFERIGDTASIHISSVQTE